MPSYNPYFPATYQPVYQPNYQYNQPSQMAQTQVQPTAPAPVQNPNSGLIWVQGEAGAKSYLVAPNTTVMLMDSEGDRFFLKSADASGMPMPLRVFEYREAIQNEKGRTAEGDLSAYATKAEFDAFKAEIQGLVGRRGTHSKKEEVEDAE